MRILLFLPDISRTGGVERVVANLANLFITWQGYEVTILSCFNTNRESPYTLNQKIKVECLGGGNYPGNPVKKLRWYLKLVRPLETYLQNQQHDIILAEGSYLCAVLGLVKSKGIVKVGCEHIGHDAVTALQKVLRRFIYPRLDLLVVLTKKDRGYFASFLPDVVQIPNFIEVQDLKPPEQMAEKVLIAAGRLTHQKGFDLLLQAYAKVVSKYPEWKLRIWGEGEDRAKLETMIMQLKLEAHISLPGETRELDRELTKADIFVMPSRYEGFPMILLEAMQSGLACISFECSGPDEIIDHEINGLLVRQNDVQGLADAMTALISDPEKQISLGKNAMKKVEQYSASNIGRQWQELFGRLIRDTTK